MGGMDMGGMADFSLLVLIALIVGKAALLKPLLAAL